MTGPDMATITASLERSLQNFSLNHHHENTCGGEEGEGISRTSSSDLQQIPPYHHHHVTNASQETLELNSHVSLPYHWEQCLDLKTGELYYLNWRTGMKAKEDPRMGTAELGNEIYSEEDESSYDSDGSSTESSASSSTDKFHNQNKNDGDEKNHVLVVAGCKRCLMYFMVPKPVEDCPKCCAQLLHFDK